MKKHKQNAFISCGLFRINIFFFILFSLCGMLYLYHFNFEGYFDGVCYDCWRKYKKNRAGKKLNTKQLGNWLAQVKHRYMHTKAADVTPSQNLLK